MIVSVDTGDFGYEVYCNDEKLEGCFYADDWLGIAKCHVLDDNGRLKTERDLTGNVYPQSKTYKGKIKIVKIKEG